MVISKEDAAQALSEVRQARERSERLQHYRHFAPYLIVWGVIWLLANTICDFYPSQANLAWLLGVIVGIVASTWLGIRDGKSRAPRTTNEGARWGLSFAVLTGFFVATFSILPPGNGMQTNAYISMFWAFAYMIVGIWSGWKIFAVGLLTAAATLGGFFLLQSHFALWMAVVGGGSLLAGGLWLRKV